MAFSRIIEKELEWQEQILSAIPAGEGRILFSAVDRENEKRYGYSDGETETGYGYMDLDGHIICPPVWMSGTCFGSGLAGVYRRMKGWGYINAEGRVELIPAWHDAKAFSEGLALVDGSRGSMFIDGQGKARITAKYGLEFCDSFHEGRAIIGSKDEDSDYMSPCDRYGFMDKNGRIIVEPQWDECENFSEGLAAVCRTERKTRLELTRKRNRWGRGMRRTVARTTRREERWGYVDLQGNLVIPPKWEVAGSFSEGLATVLDGGFQLGMIDRSGEIAIPLEYNRLSSFSGGLAAFGKCGKHGFINHKNEAVIPAEWDDCLADDFGGLRAVRKNEEWMLIDLKGNVRSEGWDDLRFSWEGDCAVGRRDGAWWVIRIAENEKMRLGAGAEGGKQA